MAWAKHMAVLLAGPPGCFREAGYFTLWLVHRKWRGQYFWVIGWKGVPGHRWTYNKYDI